MKIQELLSDLGAHIGLAQVKLDSAGVCRLTFDDSIHVDLEQHPREATALLMHTVLGTVPPEERTPFYLQLLGENYLARETNGSVLSVDRSSGEVVLWNQTDVDSADVESLAEKLTAFVQTAQDWTARLESASYDSGSSDESASQFAGMIRV